VPPAELGKKSTGFNCRQLPLKLRAVSSLSFAA
jgi:hypothetical protein